MAAPPADSFQVLSDCPTCRVEAAVVELVDPSAADGVALEARCRLCGRREEEGRVVLPGRRPATTSDARAALVRWASEEGEADLEVFCEGSFCGRSAGEVVSAIVAGEAVPTGFDVIAYLFPGAAGAGARAEVTQAAGVLPKVVDGSGAEPSLTGSASPARPAPPFIAARALCAVMLADGEVRPGERRFLDRFLAVHGLPRVTDADLLHWRPADVGRPADPGPILAAMIEVAYADRQRDGTEWRVIREFARHWDFPLETLEADGQRADVRAATAMKRLWRALSSIFVR